MLPSFPSSMSHRMGSSPHIKLSFASSIEGIPNIFRKKTGLKPAKQFYEPLII